MLFRFSSGSKNGLLPFYRGFEPFAMPTKKLPILRRLPFLASRLSSRGGHAINFIVTEPAIRVAAIEKSFPPARSGWRAFLQPFEKPSVTALAGISFEVRPGESLALL